MIVKGRRRKRHRRHVFLGNFYLNIGTQYATTVVVAIIFAGLVFTGFLLFRFVDHDDLLARGERLMVEGKIARAAHIFEFLVSKYSDSYAGHVALGRAYLSLGDQPKAENEFQIASSLKNSGNSHDADIARSKLLIAQERFDTAYSQLRALYREETKKGKNTKEQQLRLKEGILDVLEHWADKATQHTDYLTAIQKYRLALNYVTRFPEEERVKEKLTHTMGTYADVLMREKDFEGAVNVLKASLKHRYDAKTLVQVAEIYERQDQKLKAIAWYRKAFDANPEVISLKLSNMLIEQGKLRHSQGKTDDAEPFFVEADNVLKQTHLSPDKIYPVALSKLVVNPHLNLAQKTIVPSVAIELENKSHRPIHFMVVRVEFFANDTLLTESQSVLVGPADSPLNLEGADKSKKSITLAPAQPIALKTITGDTVQVKISIAYNQDKDQKWVLKGIQDIKIKGRQDAPPPGEPA